MKISIEAAGLLRKNKTGVEYYTHRLIAALARLDPEDTYELVYMAFVSKPKPQLGFEAPNVSERRISWLPGKIYNVFLRLPLGLPIDLLAGTKPDVFFFPNFIRWPLALTKRSIVAVYDTSYLDYPEVAKPSIFNCTSD